MNWELVVLGASIFVLIWEKLPVWGTWFFRLIGILPTPVQRIYDQLNCPYCAGFWIALLLHGATGLWTFPLLADAFSSILVVGSLAAWFLDALASALLIHALVLAIRGLSYPATRAHLLSVELINDDEPK
ncbi:MAG: hypothetical protein JJ894_16355 [Dinoroseobacter sp.]|nr:hypothetical protein [Dinoroseobacter sp.]